MPRFLETALKKARKLAAITLPTLPEGDYPDHVLPGLTFRVRKRRRVWTLRHRIGGQQRRETLGFFPLMGLQGARDAARKIAERVEAGVSPVQAPAHPRKAAKTLGQAIDDYERMRRAKGGKGLKSIDAALRTVRNNLGEPLKLPVKEFGKAELRDVRDQIHKRAPQQASRFLAYCGPIWKWLSQEDIVDSDIVPSVLKIAGIQKRKRVLDHDEIARIWWASYKLDRGDASQRFGALVRFLLLTAQRRGEVAALKHGHILDDVWRQQTNKADRPHRIRLPQLALDQIPGTGTADEYCFAGRGGKEMSGFSKLKVELDRLSGVEGWVLHDLRRSAASGLQELGADHMVIEAILNHAVAGVAGHYLHATLDRAKGEALQKWANEVQRIIGKRRAVS